MNVEYADQRVWIRASRAVLDQMRAGWSVPVQATASENADGSWEMTFRTCDLKSEALAEGDVTLINGMPNEERGA